MRHDCSTSDDEIVSSILGQLKRNGLDRSSDQTRGAVRDAIRHVRVVLQLDPRDVPSIPSDKNLQKARRLLGSLAERLPPEGSWREPAVRAAGIKYKCAAEAYDLVALWTSKQPTKSHDGAFVLTAELIYEAATGTACADLRRQCNGVVENRTRRPAAERAQRK